VNRHLSPETGKTHYLYAPYTRLMWAGQGSRYSDWLRAGRSGDRIPVGGARFSAPVQAGPGAHTASCTMGTGSFPGVKSGRGVTLTPQPLLVPWSRKGRAIPLLSYGPYGLYRASVPVQGCTLPLHKVIKMTPQLPPIKLRKQYYYSFYIR